MPKETCCHSHRTVCVSATCLLQGTSAAWQLQEEGWDTCSSDWMQTGLVSRTLLSCPELHKACGKRKCFWTPVIPGAENRAFVSKSTIPPTPQLKHVYRGNSTYPMNALGSQTAQRSAVQDSSRLRPGGWTVWLPWVNADPMRNSPGGTEATSAKNWPPNQETMASSHYNKVWWLEWEASEDHIETLNGNQIFLEQYGLIRPSLAPSFGVQR